ncbi:MAG: SMP-30/gluconolactonase/LRE family protein [Pirellulaceae bacterium]|nr:SMP-30/gluconolactonase/LRE family protein [Pirellulaceae bacterium]
MKFLAFPLVVLAMTSLAVAETPKTIGSIEKLDPAFEKLLPADAKIEVLASGFDWSEGVCWVKDGGFIVLSDIPPNKIMKWDPKSGTLSVFMERVGYTGKEPFVSETPEPGTNGLMLDPQGRIVACCHGDRVIKRIEKDGKLTVIADKYDGKRFNSPNDCVYKSNGDLYFTDPPYGLPQREKDPTRELDWFGVYRLGKDGKVTLLTKEMTRPNGIGFSPDEKTLYVAQSDPAAAIWKAFPVKEDGTLGDSKLLSDATEGVKKKEPGLPDGMAIDKEGHIWATGPGGVYCFAPSGKLLGRLLTGQRTANCKFGDDGKTLFICADMFLCRVKTNVTGTNY